MFWKHADFKLGLPDQAHQSRRRPKSIFIFFTHFAAEGRTFFLHFIFGEIHGASLAEPSHQSQPHQRLARASSPERAHQRCRLLVRACFGRLLSSASVGVLGALGGCFRSSATVGLCGLSGYLLARCWPNWPMWPYSNRGRRTKQCQVAPPYHLWQPLMREGW